ncbi:hypothetical protein KC327_g1750 [Hortaea werneckii]|uniref:DUF8004 domain-containing protein n=1 Tax=Hortaea werneckii EXF-2000 TaxID=1157616 RepID=A0A1Z5SZ91_HORWE|nr:hypothetical protein KC358_g4942 [Hortaea werneckii]OTA27184.1 hypothetical protein BTJ68_12838 [Hortaea werneckii EXF-2000]KAI6846419.1 hypothetical protein KC350_g3943 [Hortaea werneckii]KAI6926948.1 hypothetical protein KC348_g8515 [Hortaea werneckii]KAI6933911.1 hypothetical protein KC341_g7965 [Hortaea werneckii]
MESEARDTHQPLPSILPRKQSSVKQFNGWRRSSKTWDGLRRDRELWFEDGNCLVHLYTMGASQRGASLCLRFSDVEALRSEYLIEQCLYVQESPSPADSGYGSTQNSPIEPKQCELYIPAPAHLSREQAYLYHLTTRNFFAYATSRPVVGERLSSSLLDLLERIREWQPKSAALANFASYCQDQGYEDMAENADHAVACLIVAEHAKIKDLWREAFVHCVGMHEQIYHSPEYEGLSNTTRALITRASLEMDMHVTRVTNALGSFLEEELGPEHLGLSKAARDHLDRFRSFLHNYYVEKLGYYPPSQSVPYNKRLWTKMYHSFHCLYEFLVDTESSSDLSYARPATGGICVRQNVESFDLRHGYTSLPHPLPLLPASASEKRSVKSQKSLLSLKLGRYEPANVEKPTIREALHEATNAQNEKLLACDLVREYQRFERQRLEEKLSVVEARKVRWLLVYSALQMLISITRAPKEVRAPEATSYPLCVLTIGCPEFDDGTSSHRRVTSDPSSVFEPAAEEQEEKMEQQDSKGSESDNHFAIRPDCEAENAEDYFAAQSLSRRPSEVSLDLTPPPLRVATQLPRPPSFRSSVNSSVQALQKSIGSISRRNSLRPASWTDQQLSKSNSFGDLMAADDESVASNVRRHSLQHANVSNEQPALSMNPLAEFDFGLQDVHEEPTLEDHQLETSLDGSPTPQATPDVPDISRNVSASSLSAMASDHSGSTRSSAHLSGYDSPATGLTCWSGEASKRSSAITSSSGFAEPVSTIPNSKPGSQHRNSWAQRDLNFGAKDFGVRESPYSVNAGCYTPSGLPTVLPLSEFIRQRTSSIESARSSISSYVPDEDD